MSTTDLIIYVICFVLALLSPVWLYALVKFLPIILNGLNAAIRTLYSPVYRAIDEWAVYWEQSPEERKAWKEAMKRLKEKEKATEP